MTKTCSSKNLKKIILNSKRTHFLRGKELIYGVEVEVEQLAHAHDHIHRYRLQHVAHLHVTENKGGRHQTERHCYEVITEF